MSKNAKESLEATSQKFKESDKAETHNLLNSFLMHSLMILEVHEITS